jgi:hypothetical protein
MQKVEGSNPFSRLPGSPLRERLSIVRWSGAADYTGSPLQNSRSASAKVGLTEQASGHDTLAA